MKVYCSRIKSLRKKAGLTQKQLGTIIGYSHTAVSDWKNGLKQPGADAIILLAKTFGESADYILGLEDEDGHKTTDRENI